MNLRLTPRLSAVAEAVPQGARLVDVGTDHAYLPTWLVMEGKISRAIATDLRPGPLEKAAETVVQYGVEDRVELRLGNGLEPVQQGEVDAITIAGMGGETILEILSAAPWASETVCVVQPMTSVVDLRQGLSGAGLCITGERIVREGKTLYIILTLTGGKGELLAPEETWVGKPEHHLGDPLWPDYLAQEVGRIRRALEGMCCSGKTADEVRRQELEQIERRLSAIKPV